MADRADKRTAANGNGAKAAAPHAGGSAGRLTEKSNDFEHIIGSLMSGAGGVISSKTVVGEPVVIGDTTLIPLSDVLIGAAAGANSGEDKNAGMGGFTAKMSPNAVLILKDGATRVVNIRTQDAVTKLVDMIPEVVERILEQPAIRSMMGDDEAVEAAFPEEAPKKEGESGSR